jgi:hypothetical protein
MKVVEESAPSRIRIEKDAQEPQKLPMVFQKQYYLGV